MVSATPGRNACCDLTTARAARRATPANRVLLTCGGACLVHGEHSEHAALRREAARVAKRPEGAQSSGRVFRADTGRDPDPRPAADTRQHGHILPSIWADIGHRIADDARGGLVLPQEL